MTIPLLQPPCCWRGLWKYPKEAGRRTDLDVNPSAMMFEESPSHHKHRPENYAANGVRNVHPLAGAGEAH